MRFSTAPAAIVGLAAVALLPAVAAKPLALVEESLELQNELLVEKRQQCPSESVCGWERKLCCTNGQYCAQDDKGQAVCSASAAAVGAATSGWVFTTAVITQTSVFSTFVGGPAPTAASCASSSDCPSGYWCDGSRVCQPAAGNTPGATPGVTVTGSPTATLPFSTPIPTGANGTLVESNSGGGLSGGAIAGIVIGVILGIILLLLICFYCCARSAFHGLLAIFGLGKKRRTREETTYISEHHHSGSAAAGGRWYGQGSSRPSRPPKKSSGMGNLLGIGAGLAGLAAILGMKRKHDRRHDDKSTTVSGSSYYYSDYTSSSSASSDDRRTRNTRHSRR